MNQPSSSHCQFHPMEVFVGVCPFCLNERLLTLASLKQSHYNKHRSQQHCNSSIRGGHNFSLTAKILAISSLWNRLELRVHKTCSDDDFCDYNSGSRQRGGALRWRKRIGHIFDLIRWRNNTCSCGRWGKICSMRSHTIAFSAGKDMSSS